MENYIIVLYFKNRANLSDTDVGLSPFYYTTYTWSFYIHVVKLSKKIKRNLIAIATKS